MASGRGRHTAAHASQRSPKLPAGGPALSLSSSGHSELPQIVATCQLAGARCVLLNYPGGPFARPGLNEQLRRAARALSVDFVDIQKRFEAIAATGDVENYYVADGHCSDLGYAEIARLVAEHAMRLPR